MADDSNILTQVAQSKTNHTYTRKVLIYAINYKPEMIGCGRYTGEIGDYLLSQEVTLEVVTTPPHYPGWKALDGYSPTRYQVEKNEKLRVTRCPILLGADMRGLKRVGAPVSFAISSSLVVLWRILRFRPDVVYVIEPTLLSAPVALLAAKLIGARTVLHVQDLEIDAAFAVGHMRGQWLKSLALSFEKFSTKSFDQVITISHKMLDRLLEKGVDRDKVSIVRNWVDTSQIYPLTGLNKFREELGLPADAYVALYAGNIGAKQALNVVMDAAEILTSVANIHFIIVGNGPEKPALVARKLPNVTFLPLQPEKRLNEMLNAADIHLLPQDRNTADLVLPSKIGGILASGKPLVAMAEAGTEIHSFLADAAKLLNPGDHLALASYLKDCALAHPTTPTKSVSAALEHLNKDRAMLEIARHLNIRVLGASDLVKQALAMTENAQPSSVEIALVSYSLDGHRQDYVDLFGRLFAAPGKKLKCLNKWHAALQIKSPVLFLMIEEDPIGFVLAAISRSVLGRPTAGLLFRPREALSPDKPHLWLKNWLLKFVKLIPRTKVLTILPFEIAPAFKEIANGYIYDPQLWDLYFNEGPLPRTPLLGEVESIAKGRFIISAMGVQNHDKGFSRFVRLWLETPELRKRYLFVALGLVSKELKDLAQSFRAEGGLCYDRFVSNDEMSSLYAHSDLIWAAYEPNYDQASGIFGRAIQTGTPVVVRKGSYSESLGHFLGQQILSISGDEQAKNLLLEYKPVKKMPRDVNMKLCEDLKNRSMQTLQSWAKF